MDTMLVPPWLEKLLTTSFFRVCLTHGGVARSECNMFCLDCCLDAFCFCCKSSKHNDHRVIQIRRSSYHDVVRVSEMQKVLDVSGVQTYVINSAKVLFINERPQTKGAKDTARACCEICRRSLLNSFRFCSLGCKLVRIKSNGDARFTLDDGKSEQDYNTSNRSVDMMPSVKEIEELREGSHSQSTNTTTSMRSLARRRKRKGIPHRAPPPSCYY